MKLLSSKTHTIIGLVVGVALLLAPWLFGFNDVESAALVARLVGLFIIINELITTSDASPLKLVPMGTHIVIDCLTGAFLALSPWLFGFATLSANVWVPHVIVGLLVIGYALATNPSKDSHGSTAVYS